MTRLVLAAVLFAAWMGYLGYLVYTLPKPVSNMPVVLSRPQFLVSDLDVIGDIDLKEGTVAVRKVLYSRGGNLPDFGTPIKVINLADVTPGLTGKSNLKNCLLPLQVHLQDNVTCRITPIPKSPGFERSEVHIYPANPETLAEYDSLQKGKGNEQ
jgi:hypothetical protein